MVGHVLFEPMSIVLLTVWLIGGLLCVVYVSKGWSVQCKHYRQKSGHPDSGSQTNMSVISSGRSSSMSISSHNSSSVHSSHAHHSPRHAHQNGHNHGHRQHHHHHHHSPTHGARSMEYQLEHRLLAYMHSLLPPVFRQYWQTPSSDIPGQWKLWWTEICHHHSYLNIFLNNFGQFHHDDGGDSSIGLDHLIAAQFATKIWLWSTSVSCYLCISLTLLYLMLHRYQYAVNEQDGHNYRAHSHSITVFVLILLLTSTLVSILHNVILPILFKRIVVLVVNVSARSRIDQSGKKDPVIHEHGEVDSNTTNIVESGSSVYVPLNIPSVTRNSFESVRHILSPLVSTVRRTRTVDSSGSPANTANNLQVEEESYQLSYYRNLLTLSTDIAVPNFISLSNTSMLHNNDADNLSEDEDENENIAVGNNRYPFCRFSKVERHQYRQLIKSSNYVNSGSQLSKQSMLESIRQLIRWQRVHIDSIEEIELFDRHWKWNALSDDFDKTVVVRAQRSNGYKVPNIDQKSHISAFTQLSRMLRRCFASDRDDTINNQRMRSAGMMTSRSTARNTGRFPAKSKFFMLSSRSTTVAMTQTSSRSAGLNASTPSSPATSMRMGPQWGKSASTPSLSSPNTVGVPSIPATSGNCCASETTGEQKINPNLLPDVSPLPVATSEEISTSEEILSVLESIRNSSDRIHRREMRIFENLATNSKAADRLKGIWVFHQFIAELLGADLRNENIRNGDDQASMPSIAPSLSSLSSVIFLQKVAADFSAYSFPFFMPSLRRQIIELILLIVSISLLNMVTVFAIYSILMRQMNESVFAKVEPDNHSIQFIAIVGLVVIEIVVLETVACLFFQYYLPLLIRNDMKEIELMLQSVNHQMCKILTNKFHRHLIFNGSSYGLVSYQVAQSLPHLLESMIISAYLSYLPGPIHRKWCLSSSKRVVDDSSHKISHSHNIEKVRDSLDETDEDKEKDEDNEDNDEEQGITRDMIINSKSEDSLLSSMEGRLLELRKANEKPHSTGGKGSKVRRAHHAEPEKIASMGLFSHLRIWICVNASSRFALSIFRAPALILSRLYRNYRYLVNQMRNKYVPWLLRNTSADLQTAVIKSVLVIISIPIVIAISIPLDRSFANGNNVAIINPGRNIMLQGLALVLFMYLILFVLLLIYLAVCKPFSEASPITTAPLVELVQHPRRKENFDFEDSGASAIQKAQRMKHKKRKNRLSGSEHDNLEHGGSSPHSVVKNHDDELASESLLHDDDFFNEQSQRLSSSSKRNSVEQDIAPSINGSGSLDAATGTAGGSPGGMRRILRLDSRITPLKIDSPTYDPKACGSNPGSNSASPVSSARMGLTPQKLSKISPRYGITHDGHSANNLDQRSVDGNFGSSFDDNLMTRSLAGERRNSDHELRASRKSYGSLSRGWSKHQGSKGKHERNSREKEDMKKANSYNRHQLRHFAIFGESHHLSKATPLHAGTLPFSFSSSRIGSSNLRSDVHHHHLSHHNQQQRFLVVPSPLECIAELNSSNNTSEKSLSISFYRKTALSGGASLCSNVQDSDSSVHQSAHSSVIEEDI